jgi:3-methyladenine DNA glycosylase AlkD
MTSSNKHTSLSLSALTQKLHTLSDTTPERQANYFKTGPGDYAEHEYFLGIKASTLRKLCRQSLYANIDCHTMQTWLTSPLNEIRLFTLMIMVNQFKHTKDPLHRLTLYQCYLNHRHRINNWNLIDNSAHWIIGGYIYPTWNPILIELAKSKSLWDRRIAIVASYYFIKQGQFKPTLTLCKLCLNDKEDLIHKACGWMLREVGKQNKSVLTKFLEQTLTTLPRTTLRYAIEHFSAEERSTWLKQ